MIGDRIKVAREKLNIKRKEFAEAIGISINYLSEIESNKKVPSKPILLLIECRFSINIEWLKNGEGEMLLKKGKPIVEFIDSHTYPAIETFTVFTQLIKALNDSNAYTPEELKTMILNLGLELGFDLSKKPEDGDPF